MDKEILDLFKISGLNNISKYTDVINSLDVNSVNMLIDSCENKDELDELLTKYSKQFTPSMFANIIKKFCQFGNIEPAKIYLSNLVYKYAYPHNRHIEPILELLYFDESVDNIDYMNKLFEYYKVFHISMPSDTAIKFMIYYSKHNIKFLEDNLELLQLNFKSNELNPKYLKYLTQDNKHIKSLKPIDLSLKNKNHIIKHLTQKYEYLPTFLNFLENSAYDVLIDGANLGYYGNTYPLNQNYINSCLEYFEKIGKTPLIILHKKHINNFHHMKKWINNKQIYFTDFGQNDDHYWIAGSLKISLSRDVKLVTNDRLRDHIFEIIGNTANISTYMDTYITKYIQNYKINKHDNRNPFSIIPMYEYNNTVYKIGNKIGFPLKNKFYLL